MDAPAAVAPGIMMACFTVVTLCALWVSKMPHISFSFQCSYAVEILRFSEIRLNFIRKSRLVHFQKPHHFCCLLTSRIIGRSIDKCGGYAGKDGVYKYHVAPVCLLQQLRYS